MFEVVYGFVVMEVVGLGEFVIELVLCSGVCGGDGEGVVVEVVGIGFWIC